MSRTALPDVIAAVETGEADLGIVPIENSIEGSITITLDTLAFESDLLIQREVVRPVSLNLIARAGTKLADVPPWCRCRSDRQCRQWLRRRLPRRPVGPRTRPRGPSSGLPVRARRGFAAIGTHLAAELNGLS